MRKRTLCDLPRSSGRASFTLIELLVVIAIIAALMALSASAVIKFLGSQEEANTRATFDKTQSQLNKAWSKVKDQANKETIPPAVDQWIRTNLAQLPNEAFDVTTGRVRVIYIKLKQRQAFPMNFTEALTPPTLPPNNVCPLPPLPAYTTYLGSLGISASTGSPYESSACLLMALQRGVSGAGVNPDDLSRGGATGSVQLAGGKNLPYLTDAWGQPIYFARFPTGRITAQAGANDPGDPQGFLQTPSWGTKYGQAFTLVTQQGLAPSNSSFKLAPLLASTGQDRARTFDLSTFAPLSAANGYGDDLFSGP
jgi:prepilin-type N-terminal cleavage/methylation domain-containing protein